MNPQPLIDAIDHRISGYRAWLDAYADSAGSAETTRLDRSAIDELLWVKLTITEQFDTEAEQRMED